MSDEDTALSRSELLEMAADIVRAYVSHNDVKADNLPSLIQSVFDSVESIATADVPKDTGPRPEPAVPIADSYREKWGLPRDYPMVAPNYAKRRSALAKKTGLGKSRS